MFEKLLSLLLQAKSGAVATVFVLGASGALVTATVTDGVATITVTPNESSTTSSTTTDSNTTTPNSVEQAILALFNRTSAEDDPTSTATGQGCSDEAHERNDAMKDVNDALKDLHQDVLGLSKNAPKSAETRALVKGADSELKDLRQEAVMLIHGTFDCDPNEDEDTTPTSTTDTTTTDTTGTITGDTAEEIAASAIALMEEVVAKLEEALNPEDAESDEATTTSTNTNGKSDSNKPENKGKGNGKGRSR
jgi:hypothetical protein